MSDDPTRTTPRGLITYAKSYRNASLIIYEKLKIEERYKKIASEPVMYLIAHSMELSLKAFLLYEGIDLKDLKNQRKYGHNLINCIKKAKELGLEEIVKVDDLEIAALEILNNLYSAKELNYIVTGYKRYPVFGPLETLSKKLLIGIGNKIGYPAHRLAK